MAARAMRLDPVPTLRDEAVGDLRFRNLLSASDWAALPPKVRRRFSRRLADGASVVYAGEVVETRMSAAGRFFAQLCRLVGGPLPLTMDAGVPAVVTVTEDMAGGGQNWTRLYARRRGFPQIIHSAKRFGGPTGLEEYVGRRVGMALTVHVAEDALIFRSAGCFVRFGRARIPIPRWLTPGDIVVTHAEWGEGGFMFVLEVRHPLWGPIIQQIATFRDTLS
ncbi:MAG TPA: DUF4166 domain-containing protein [Rhizomicrobium sp.]|nr:DUF4166 domain-containing protein [Rhizomicrobium sp.]